MVGFGGLVFRLRFLGCGLKLWFTSLTFGCYVLNSPQPTGIT